MARIDGSSPKLPLIPGTRVEAPKPSQPSLPTNATQGVKGDDFGSRQPTRIPSGRYPSVVRTNPKLAEEFASLTAASRSGLLAVKSGGGGAETKAFTPASFAKSIAGKSREQTGEAYWKLEPKQQEAVKAALLKGSLKSPQLATAVLSAMPPKDQQEFLKKLPKEGLKELTQALRAEAAPEQIKGVVVAVSVELAARTRWAEKNPEAMKALRATHAGMHVMGGEKDGLGSFRNGEIKYADKLLKSPEALAATLAHEAVHVHQGATCCGGAGDTSPAGEAQGTMAGAQVWGELKPSGKDDRLESNNLTQLNKYTGLAKGKDGEKAVLKEVTTQYMNRAQEKVDERKARPDKDWKTGDTASDWQKYVDVYKKKLDELK
jgi:hypothetical protein